MIKVKHEPMDLMEAPPEKCFRCGCETRFWYEPKDVAVCRECAKSLGASDVPSKAQWLGVVEREPND